MNNKNKITTLEDVNNALFYNTWYFYKRGDRMSDEEFKLLNDERLYLLNLKAKF